MELSDPVGAVPQAAADPGGTLDGAFAVAVAVTVASPLPIALDF